MNLFRLRATEWLASTIIFMIGLISLVWPQTFYRPFNIEFLSYAPQWIIACLIIGAGRLVALFVNGHWNGGTPALRLLGAIAGASIFGALVGNYLHTQNYDQYGVSWSVGTYFILLCIEMFSVFAAATDLAKVKKYGG